MSTSSATYYFLVEDYGILHLEVFSADNHMILFSMCYLVTFKKNKNCVKEDKRHKTLALSHPVRFFPISLRKA